MKIEISVDLCAIMEAELRFSQQVLAIPEKKIKKNKRKERNCVLASRFSSRIISKMQHRGLVSSIEVYIYKEHQDFLDASFIYTI